MERGESVKDDRSGGAPWSAQARFWERGRSGRRPRREHGPILDRLGIHPCFLLRGAANALCAFPGGYLPERLLHWKDVPNRAFTWSRNFVSEGVTSFQFMWLG